MRTEKGIWLESRTVLATVRVDEREMPLYIIIREGSRVDRYTSQ